MRLLNALVQADRRPEAGGLDPLVAHDVVALVGILAHVGHHERELRDVLLDLLAELPLADVRVAQADVVGPALHRVVVGQGVAERPSPVANVQVVALEVRLEQHHEAVDHCPIREVVDQQVEPHPGAGAEQRREPERDAVAPIEQVLLELDLQSPVERDRPQRRGLVAFDVRFADAVAAVRRGKDQHLLGAQLLGDRADGVEVDRLGRPRVLGAHRRAGQACQRQHRVGASRPSSISSSCPARRHE